jgi:anti-sigma factor RsiW
VTTNAITSSQPLSADPTCREVIDFIRAYLDGELSVPERAAFDEHLRQCRSCVAYIETYRASIVMAKLTMADPAATTPPVPKGLASAIMQSIRHAQAKNARG